MEHDFLVPATTVGVYLKNIVGNCFEKKASSRECGSNGRLDAPMILSSFCESNRWRPCAMLEPE
jgi:hypothetical protein